MSGLHSAVPATILGVSFVAIVGSVSIAEPPVGASAAAKVADWAPADEAAESVPAAEVPARTGVRLDDGVAWPTDKRTVKRLEAVSEELGKPLVILSGKRELGTKRNPKPGTQWYFWKKYRAGKGNLAAYPNPNAPHIRGYAADVVIEQPDGELTNVGHYATGRRLLRKHGLVLSVPGEPWHVAPAEVNRWAYRP